MSGSDGLGTTQALVVMQALRDALAARPRLRALQVPVDIGWPVGGPSDPAIWIDGQVEDWTEEWSYTGVDGPGAKDEAFTLTVNTVRTSTAMGGITFWDAAIAALDIAGEIDRTLMDDFTLGLPDTRCSVTEGALAEGIEEGARQIFIVRKIRVDTTWVRDL